MDNRKPLVSVIIPIYNVEKYLRECLDSVINQSYKHLEIILINDGSTDSSGAIVQEYAKKDYRIRYFEQENQGGGVARNTGLEKAQGEWVCFVDSDDYVDLDWVDEFVRYSDKDNVIINANVLFEFNDKSQRFNIHKMPKGSIILSPNNITSFDFFVTNCLFPKSLIDLYQLRFIEGKIWEDAGFLYQILPFAQCIVCIDAGAYHYRQRQDSLTGELAMYNEVTFDRIYMFIFLTHWYRKHSLIDKCGLPFHLLYEIYPFHHNAEIFYQRAKEVIRELAIPKEVWQKDKLMTLFMDKESALDFMNVRGAMQKTPAKRFRIRLSKEYSVIKLFGRIVYENI